MNTRTTIRLIVCVAVAVILVSAIPASAVTVYTTQYNNSTGALTIAVTTPTGNWNDLEIECLTGDVPADFSTTTTNWSIHPSIISRDGKKFVRMVRSAPISTAATVVITGPKGRGGHGTISRTLNGTVLDQSAMKQTFLIEHQVPTLTTWGMIILGFLIVMTAGWLLMRRRQPSVA